MKNIGMGNQEANPKTNHLKYGPPTVWSQRKLKPRVWPSIGLFMPLWQLPRWNRRFCKEVEGFSKYFWLSSTSSEFNFLASPNQATELSVEYNTTCSCFAGTNNRIGVYIFPEVSVQPAHKTHEAKKSKLCFCFTFKLKPGEFKLDCGDWGYINEPPTVSAIISACGMWTWLCSVFHEQRWKSMFSVFWLFATFHFYMILY